MSAESYFIDADIQVAAGDIKGATQAFLYAYSYDSKATKDHITECIFGDQKRKMVSALYDLLKVESSKTR